MMGRINGIMIKKEQEEQESMKMAEILYAPVGSPISAILLCIRTPRPNMEGLHLRNVMNQKYKNQVKNKNYSK